MSTVGGWFLADGWSPSPGPDSVPDSSESGGVGKDLFASGLVGPAGFAGLATDDDVDLWVVDGVLCRAICRCVGPDEKTGVVPP